MKKLTAIFIMLLVIVITQPVTITKADEHGVADGACDPLCEAQNECLSYVYTIDNEIIFYLVVADSERSIVRTNCVFNVGLQI
jgi:hypothetical protein